MPKRAIHTRRNENGRWTNVTDTESQTVITFLRKVDAEAAARDWARRNDGDHVVHGVDGSIESHHSYDHPSRST